MQGSNAQVPINPTVDARQLFELLKCTFPLSLPPHFSSRQGFLNR